jgi:hypothetical protein
LLTDSQVVKTAADDVSKSLLIVGASAEQNGQAMTRGVQSKTTDSSADQTNASKPVRDARQRLPHDRDHVEAEPTLWPITLIMLAIRHLP